MLIPNDSPLRRIPITTETRTVLFLDGIRYSMEITDLAFRRLEEILGRITRLEGDQQALGVCIVEAMLDAWAVVDSVHRLRELVQQLPGLKQKEPSVQVFLRKTKNVETLRHFVQHFRSGIDGFVAKRMPLWGTLSWSQFANDTGMPESHTIVPGTFYHGVQAASCIFDREEWKFIERIVLHAADAKVDLEELFQSVAAFYEWFVRWYSGVQPSADWHAADVHLRVTLAGMGSRDHGRDAG